MIDRLKVKPGKRELRRAFLNSIYNNCETVVRFFVKRYAYEDIFQSDSLQGSSISPSKLATEKNFPNILEIVLPHECPDSNILERALLSAVRNVSHKCVAILLNQTCTIPSFQPTVALQVAIEQGDLKIVQLILDHPNFDVSSTDFKAVKDALKVLKATVAKLDVK